MAPHMSVVPKFIAINNRTMDIYFDASSVEVAGDWSCCDMDGLVADFAAALNEVVRRHMKK